MALFGTYKAAGDSFMLLLSPDILETARELSPVVTGTSFVIGLFLWLFGAWSHRFWLALVMTLAAGVFGLEYGSAYGMQPLVAGLLLAVTAGALALSLMRLLLFAVGGLVGLMANHALSAAWDQPIACFLVGGLVGVLMYRFWITALASLTGTLLMGYSGLCLATRFTSFDVIGWTGANGPLLNWASGAVAVLGMLVQFLLERRRRRKKREAAFKAAERAKPKPKPQPPPPTPQWSWWSWATMSVRGKAG
jgi:hypothetical protein